MTTGAASYLPTLGRFVSGDATIAELKDAIAVRLSDLRESMDVTDEQRALSTIELLIEELREGDRLRSELHAVARQVFERQTGLAAPHPSETASRSLMNWGLAAQKVVAVARAVALVGWLVVGALVMLAVALVVAVALVGALPWLPGALPWLSGMAFAVVALAAWVARAGDGGAGGWR